MKTSGTASAGPRTRPGAGLRMAAVRMLPIRMLAVAACGLALAGCGSSAPQGPNTSVTAPTGIGRPPAPATAEAAFAQAAFTPYAGLGSLYNDGLAPDESFAALAADCATTAGYPQLATSGDLPVSIHIGASLTLSPDYGQFGYLSMAQAKQSGFQPDGSLIGLATGSAPTGGGDIDSLPAAEQAVALKCAEVEQNFETQQDKTSMAVIQTLTQDILSDVQNDADVHQATQAWHTCMATNGYDYATPSAAFQDAIQKYIGAKQAGSGGGNWVQSTPTENSAQIALAVTDAQCTQTSDLGGIYFAVLSSYEKQIVDLNLTRLTAAVQDYRTGYQKAVSAMDALLSAASARPGPGGPGLAGGSPGASPAPAR